MNLVESFLFVGLLVAISLGLFQIVGIHVQYCVTNAWRHARHRTQVGYPEFARRHLFSASLWGRLGCVALSVTLGFVSALWLLAQCRTIRFHSLVNSGVSLRVLDTLQSHSPVPETVVLPAHPLILLETDDEKEVNSLIRGIRLAPILRIRQTSVAGRYIFQFYYRSPDEHLVEKFAYQPGGNIHFFHDWYSDWPLTDGTSEFLANWMDTML
jgi:hypothetical protein